MATVLRAKLSTLLLKIAERLVVKQVFSEDATMFSLRMNPPVMGLQAESYAIVLPLTFAAKDSTNRGAGRYNTIAVGRVDVYVRHRAATDEPYRDKDWMTAPQAGILDLEDAVYDALEEFIPVDDAGNGLTAWGLKWVFTGEPKKRMHSDPTWGDIVCEYELAFQRQATLPEM